MMMLADICGEAQPGPAVQEQERPQDHQRRPQGSRGWRQLNAHDPRDARVRPGCLLRPRHPPQGLAAAVINTPTPTPILTPTRSVDWVAGSASQGQVVRHDVGRECLDDGILRGRVVSKLRLGVRVARLWWICMHDHNTHARGTIHLTGSPVMSQYRF